MDIARTLGYEGGAMTTLAVVITTVAVSMGVLAFLRPRLRGRVRARQCGRYGGLRRAIRRRGCRLELQTRAARQAMYGRLQRLLNDVNSPSAPPRPSSCNLGAPSCTPDTAQKRDADHATASRVATPQPGRITS